MEKSLNLMLSKEKKVTKPPMLPGRMVHPYMEVFMLLIVGGLDPMDAGVAGSAEDAVVEDLCVVLEVRLDKVRTNPKMAHTALTTSPVLKVISMPKAEAEVGVVVVDGGLTLVEEAVDDHSSSVMEVGVDHSFSKDAEALHEMLENSMKALWDLSGQCPGAITTMRMARVTWKCVVTCVTICAHMKSNTIRPRHEVTVVMVVEVAEVTCVRVDFTSVVVVVEHHVEVDVVRDKRALVLTRNIQNTRNIQKKGNLRRSPTARLPYKC